MPALFAYGYIHFVEEHLFNGKMWLSCDLLSGILDETTAQRGRGLCDVLRRRGQPDPSSSHRHTHCDWHHSQGADAHEAGLSRHHSQLEAYHH